jgi:hypothetical protein
MRYDKYVIEARDEKGELLLGKYPQPESFFGIFAIKGITENCMADAIFRKIPDASLQGADIPNWPKLIDPNWIARRKTW